MRKLLWWVSDRVIVIIGNRQAIMRLLTFQSATWSLNWLSDISIVADIWLCPWSMHSAWVLDLVDILSYKFCSFLKRVAVLIRKIELIFCYFIIFEDFVYEVHLRSPLKIALFFRVDVWTCKTTASKERNVVSFILLSKRGKKGCLAFKIKVIFVCWVFRCINKVFLLIVGWDLLFHFLIIGRIGSLFALR